MKKSTSKSTSYKPKQPAKSKAKKVAIAGPGKDMLKRKPMA